MFLFSFRSIFRLRESPRALVMKKTMKSFEVEPTTRGPRTLLGRVFMLESVDLGQLGQIRPNEFLHILTCSMSCSIFMCVLFSEVVRCSLQDMKGLKAYSGGSEGESFRLMSSTGKKKPGPPGRLSEAQGGGSRVDRVHESCQAFPDAPSGPVVVFTDQFAQTRSQHKRN